MAICASIDGCLRFEKALAQRAELPRVFARAVFENALARFEAEIQAVERAVVLFEFIDDREALQVVLEAAVIAHAFVQRILSGMAERRMAEIVRQRNGFDQVFVDAQIARHRARDLRDFETVRQTRAKQVALVIDEDLRLVFEPAERRRVNDAVAVALELGARNRRFFFEAAATRLGRMRGIRGEMRLEREGRRRDAGKLECLVAHRLLRIIVASLFASLFLLARDLAWSWV